MLNCISIYRFIHVQCITFGNIIKVPHEQKLFYGGGIEPSHFLLLQPGMQACYQLHYRWNLVDPGDSATLKPWRPCSFYHACSYHNVSIISSCFKFIHKQDGHWKRNVKKYWNDVKKYWEKILKGVLNVSYWRNEEGMNNFPKMEQNNYQVTFPFRKKFYYQHTWLPSFHRITQNNLQMGVPSQKFLNFLHSFFWVTKLPLK